MLINFLDFRLLVMTAQLSRDTEKNATGDCNSEIIQPASNKNVNSTEYSSHNLSPITENLALLENERRPLRTCVCVEEEEISSYY